MKIFLSAYFLALCFLYLALVIYCIIINRRFSIKPKISFLTFLRDYSINPKRWLLSSDSVYFIFGDGDTQEYQFYFIDNIRYYLFYKKRKKVENKEKKEKVLNKLYQEINGDIKNEEKEEIWIN